MPDVDSLNERVAEKVMGWRRTDGGWQLPDGQCFCQPLDFISDPAADYSVLERVRDTWLFSRRQAFVRELVRLWQTPLGSGSVEIMPNAVMRYLPGDYASAALAVVKSAEATKP